ncbi:MAG: BREX system P-loop protein BrxC [Bacteroidales bacterium]|nr:BREX system P-loop protein BrxC [Bacteroidales bacterium]
MKLKEIYRKPITRSVNPAVSATKFDRETVTVEIQEYVFTDEILNGLYQILSSIRNNRGFDHIGIWIDGYYGSGKSHFLKYLDYLITPDYSDEAFSRMEEAVSEVDPFSDLDHNISFSLSDLQDLHRWVKGAEIATCIFNLETSDNASRSRNESFLHVFWNEFNGYRGLNKFNLFLAQLLEKPLQEKGVFDEFKRRMSQDFGANWEDPNEAADIIDQELDMVLDLACDLAPTLSRDSIRERLIKRDITISIERFAAELKAFLDTKGPDYRLILLADEVSQFINKQRDRFLNLQELVSRISQTCDNRVWIACTAQQDESEVRDDCNVRDNDENEDRKGKIMGRFQVKVSLAGTKAEVITQKRILDKTDTARATLGKHFDEKQAEIEMRFKLPTQYDSYHTRQTFVDYYPFIPYQFKLITKVFDNFLAMEYVAKEVKGNERSLIKVVHDTAKNCAEAEIGKFVAFDELFNTMFTQGLQHKGHRAMENATKAAQGYARDPRLARRVVNILFMICNISDNEKNHFPATAENVATLLINDLETPWITLKKEVEDILVYLEDEYIIRRERHKGLADTFSFFSEEERIIATLIQNTVIDQHDRSSCIHEVIKGWFKSLKNKEQRGTRSFSVSLRIDNFSPWGNANAEIPIEFTTDTFNGDVYGFAFRNPEGKLAFYMGPQVHADRNLLTQLEWYCKLTKYLATPASGSENKDIRDKFRKRGAEIFSEIIEPTLRRILDTCPVVTGPHVMDESETSTRSGDERFRSIMKSHLDGIYKKSHLVEKAPHSTADLRVAIQRPINPGDYEDLNATLTEPERDVDRYLDTQFGEVNASDVVAKFRKPPYGWDEIATLYICNELVRRHARDWSYANDPNVESTIVAQRLASDTNKFTLRKGVAISRELVRAMLDAWKAIFGNQAAIVSTDSTQVFHQSREGEAPTALRNIISSYNRLLQNNPWAFAQPLREVVDLFEEWLKIRDTEEYFKRVVADRDRARALMDTAREVVSFINDQRDAFKNLIEYARANDDNFSFLPDELQPLTTTLTTLATAPWPVSIRSCNNAKKQIEAALANVRAAKRQEVEAAYRNAYQWLVQSCQENDIDPSILANVDSIIMAKTASNKLLVLENNSRIKDWFGQQRSLINGAVRKREMEEQRRRERELQEIKDAEERKRRKEELRKKEELLAMKPVNFDLPKCHKALATEAEIDEYLASLKSKLMSYIHNGNSIYIN